MIAVRRRLAAVPDAAIGLGAAVIAIALLVAVETGVVSGLLHPPGSRTVRAVFADARQLTTGDPVRISGVNVGTVGSVALRGRSAMVTMQLGNNAGPLYDDAGAQIRFRTLLGGNFYVDLSRGNRGAGALRGATIPAARTGSQTEVDDLTSIVQGGAKRGLQTMPGELAKALSDPRYPAQTLETLAEQSPALAGGLGALRGSQPTSDLRTLIDSANTTVQALDAPEGQLRRLVSSTASFLQATGARSADLQRTLAGAPALLARADTTMRSLRGTLTVVNPLLVRLERPAPQVSPTVRELRATVEPANVLLGHATPLLRDLRPAVTSLSRASAQALPLLHELTPSLDELADTILPYAAEIQPDSKHSMAEMIGPGLAGLGAMGAYEDNDGHFARFPATAGNASFYLPCQVYFADSEVKQLLACESISQALGTIFGGAP
jgi:virulence factor Mce-like protein